MLSQPRAPVNQPHVVIHSTVNPDLERAVKEKNGGKNTVNVDWNKQD